VLSFIFSQSPLTVYGLLLTCKQVPTESSATLSSAFLHLKYTDEPLRSDTTWCFTPLACRKSDPHGPTRSHQDLSFTQARRVKELFQLLSGVLSTHRLLFGDLPFASREIGFRDIANPVCTFSCNFKTPNPDGQRSTLSTRRGFPYREIAMRCRNFTRLSKPEPEVPNSDQCHLYSTPLVVPHCHVTSRDFGDRGSTICKFFLCNGNPECRIPTSRDLVPPVLSDRRLRLIREIATRDFNEHETLASSNAECRTPMALVLPAPMG
jgi:hypothetical protein